LKTKPISKDRRQKSEYGRQNLKNYGVEALDWENETYIPNITDLCLFGELGLVFWISFIIISVSWKFNGCDWILLWHGTEEKRLFMR
jgi:hypothetical protein